MLRVPAEANGWTAHQSETLFRQPGSGQKSEDDNEKRIVSGHALPALSVHMVVDDQLVRICGNAHFPGEGTAQSDDDKKHHGEES
jgi:hypothetical protein